MSTQANSGLARRRAQMRRAIIATLVLICLGLLTGYFRESDSGPLHGVQSSAAGVVAPIQDVASRAVQPFRDAWNWASDFKDARDRAARLEDEVRDLRSQLAADEVDQQRLDELERLNQVRRDDYSGYRPVGGRVIQRQYTPWFRNARINVGRSDGVLRNSPVVASDGKGAGLVGVVYQVRSNSADVAFITDGRTEVGAQIDTPGPLPARGLVQSVVPGELRMTGIPRGARVERNQLVSTSGAGTMRLPSIYPAGIPIGYVTSVSPQEPDIQQTVQVTPMVSPENLSYMYVLVPESAQAKRRAAG